VPTADTVALAAGLDPPLTIVDVGVRGGIEDAWTPLLPNLHVYGFDPDPEECERLTVRYGSPNVTFVPLALGAQEGPATLHLTADPACSSLYPPDELTADLYRALEVTTQTGTRAMTLDTLDRWAEREGITDVSYLKLDTQGSELEILRGATRLLRTVWAVHAEVEFNPIYRGQPLFGDVDTFMREHGFVLWRLTNLCHYTLGGVDAIDEALDDRQVFAASPREGTAVEFAARAGRLFWGEAFFVRRELAERVRPTTPAAAARAACVLTVLGFHELAAVCLRKSTSRLRRMLGRLL
jgi:FkbM family methyltransferase